MNKFPNIFMLVKYLQNFFDSNKIVRGGMSKFIRNLLNTHTKKKKQLSAYYSNIQNNNIGNLQINIRI